MDERFPEVIPGLIGKKIFITGGTGFLGSLILKTLKTDSNHSGLKTFVTVLSRDPSAFQKKRPELLWDGLSFLKGDIQSFRFDRDTHFDFIIHGGNPASVSKNEMEALEFWKTTVEGTRHLLDEIGRLQKLPTRILLLSSGAVYKTRLSGEIPISERFETLPPPSGPRHSLGNIYAEAKLATEIALAEFCTKRKIRLTIGRVFACAGPYLPLEGRFALGQFIRSARDTSQIRIRSDGTPLRSYLAGVELTKWLLTLLVSPNVEQEILNIGSDDAISIREIAETVQKCFKNRGKEILVEFEQPLPGTAASLSEHYVPDIRKMMENYGLKPIKSSIQAIQETTEWVLNEG